MELKRYYDDYDVGDTASSAAGRTVTETDIFRAAGYEYGGQVHVDKEYMKNTEFGDIIVQNTVLIMVTNALWQDLPGWEFEASVAYGRDNMRFVNPAYPGDTLYLEAEVVDTRIRENDREQGRDRGLLTINEKLLNQHGDLVLINDHLTLVKFSPDFSPD